ncbi:MAG: ABC transporter permease [Desulfocapsa sp.]|nr:ABC transporter permease [Desulfocapsa sp.]
MVSSRISFILEMTRRDFVERFAGSILGSLWAFIFPLVNLLVYLIVFGKIIGARLPGTSDMYAYGIYIAVGIIPWGSFSNTVTRSTNIFSDKKNIITKLNTPLPSLFVHVSLSEALTFIISITLMFIILALKGASFHCGYFLLPFVFYLQQILAIGIGLLTASLSVFITDIRQLVSVVMQLWFWFTPIIYVVDILPDFAQKLMVLNPMFYIVDGYHNIFVYGAYPVFKPLIILTVISHLLLAFSYMTFRYLEKDIRDFL